MLALKEFANFISLNVANLAATYDRLLVEMGGVNETLPTDSRIASARRLIKTVAEACEMGTPEPFCHLFEGLDDDSLPTSVSPKFAQPWLQIECLGQTLTPIVTNLEAGKFLWRMLAEARTTVFRAMSSTNQSANSQQDKPDSYASSLGPAEKAVLAEGHLLRTLIDNVPDYIYIKDVDSRFILVNPATAHLLGVKAIEEVIGKTDADFFPPKLARQFRADEQALMRSGQPLLNHEERAIDQKTGKPVWNLTTKVPLRDPQGKVIGLVGINRDITTYKETEKALQAASEAELRQRRMAGSLSEATNILTSSLDRETVLAKIMEQLRQVVNFDSGAVFLREGQDLVLSSGVGVTDEYIGFRVSLSSDLVEAQVFNQKQPLVIEDVRLEPRWPIWSEDDPIRGWMAVPLLIGQEAIGILTADSHQAGMYNEQDAQVLQTFANQVAAAIENARLFQEVQRERQLLRTLIDHLPDTHIFIKDTSNRFVITNLAHLQISGFKTAEEIIGKTDFDLFPHELAEQYYTDEQVVMQSGQPMLNRVEPVLDQAGKTRWYLTSKFPLRDEQEAVIGIVGLSLDITERRRLEQQIQGSLARLTRQIQAITEVAQRISGTLTLNDLFQQVVDLMQTQFGYYHAQIYTMVEGDMMLQAGTGEIGRRLKERGHNIPLSAEQSLVVRAVWEGEPVLVPDVSQEPTWLPNPLLPETKAELAVPITLGAEVLGVLDVQSDELGGLNEEDRLLLIGLCGQIAIAIETRKAEAERAKLLAEVERRARREQTIREITEKMRAATSLEQLVTVTARELGERLTAGHAVVELGVAAMEFDSHNQSNVIV
jgi:PAS domain S-box-containing protein